MQITLGEKIMQLRQKQRLSQEAFGEALGVSRQAVSKWETGQAMPDIDKIVAISSIFGVSTDYLLKCDECDERSEKSQNSCGHPDNENHSPVEKEDPTTASNEGALWERLKKKIARLEYKSKTTVFGVPLVHIKLGRAKGVIAIGLSATGALSIGLLSIGPLSWGILSIGLLATGTFALGGISIGAVSAGILALGGVAFGVFTVGGVSIGMYSMGGCAIASKIAFGGYARGFIAIGDKVSGTYTWHIKDGIPESMREEIYKIICRELPNTPKFIVNIFK